MSHPSCATPAGQPGDRLLRDAAGSRHAARVERKQLIIGRIGVLARLGDLDGPASDLELAAAYAHVPGQWKLRATE